MRPINKPIYDDQGEPLIQIDEIVQLTQLSYPTIHAYIYKGVRCYDPKTGTRKTIYLRPYSSVGRYYLFRRSDVLRFLQLTAPHRRIPAPLPSEEIADEEQ